MLNGRRLKKNPYNGGDWIDLVKYMIKYAGKILLKVYTCTIHVTYLSQANKDSVSLKSANMKVKLVLSKWLNLSVKFVNRN